MKANLFSAKHRSFLAVLALATWVAAPVWGDDTEIFFGGTSVEGVRPNVLFIMDTSGSMSSRPSGSPRGSPSKINIVKDALKQLVTEVNEVNIGLMRFSNPGGPVIYPVTYIENKVGFDPGAPVQVLADVSQDGQENLNDSSVILDGLELAMGTGGTGGASAPVLERRLIDRPDDANQYYGSDGNGGMENDAWLCLGGQGFNCDRQRGGDDRDEPDRAWLMGLRWGDLQVPQGALVTEAELELYTWDAANRDFLVDTYAGEPPFDGFGGGATIFERSRLPVPPVRWNMQDRGGRRPAPGEKIYSPNLSSLVQAAVDHPGWNSTGGDFGLILEMDLDDSPRRGLRMFADAFYSAFDVVPKLTVRYELPSVGPTERFGSALKFDNVGVPLGVDVTSAKLVLTPVSTTNSASDVTVRLENTAAPADLAATPGNLSARAAGASSTTISLGAGDWQNGVPVELDVTSLVNPRVQQAGWCGGDPLVFLLDSPGATRLFASAEAGGSLAARLEVEYAPDTLVPGSSCRNISYTRQVTASEDDGQTNGSAVSSDATIAIGASGSGVFRFTSLQIPSSADVSEAYLTVTADQDAGGSADFLISVENVGDSPAIDSNGIAGRSFVGSIPWSISEDWTKDAGYRSPNIKALVDRALSNGLGEGDAMTLKLDFSAGSGRALKAFEQGQLTSATLRVVFEDDGSLGANTVREEFARAVDSLSASGFTPIQDTLFEAYQYYAGEEVVWGKFRGGHEADGSLITYGAAEDGPFTYARTSVEGSITSSSWGGNRLPSGCPGPDSSDRDCNDSNGSGQPQGEYLLGNPIYKSPIDDQCQAESHIVFLTDGLANEPHSRSLIESVIGTTSCPSSGRSAEACTAELAGWMQNNDMSDLPGDQKVTTHTVGFDNDDPFLETIATLGGGEYKQANDLNSLVAEFRAILASVLKTNTSFVAPVAAINQFNRLTNLDDVYFAVFRPDSVPKWSGNLKRYKLASVGGVDNVLVDVNGNPAVDSNTGFFETSAQSYWSSAPDGAEVEEGGAAENLPPYADGGRKIYSNISGSAVLSNAANGVRVGNGTLTDTMLGVTGAERDDHIRWIRGQDVDDEDADSVTNEARYSFGDPLHSRPVAVNYGTSTTSDVTLYFGTNAGFLHAIDADTGAEEFSFLPKELFGLQEELRANDSADDHYYGIDGSPAVWTDEGSTPGLGNDSADFVRLYIGQRRGGRNYYALDVTDRANPELMWKITGGSTTGFGELGQTWGRPIPGVLNVGGTKTDVLYISGGYDPAKDGTTLRAADSMGRAIYIVNALDGSLIWSGGFSGGSFTKTFADMDYSIPATLTVIDVDNDGLDDGIYVGDTGGQVWRFDINNGGSGAGLISGGVIARFGATGATDPAANRMFFHSPDVALIDIEGVRKLAVTIGSGARPSPLSEFAQDRFYTIFQSTVYGAPSSYVTLTEASDFYDATSNLLQTGTEAEVEAAEIALAGASGWYVDFSRSGEKVLSTPLSFRNTVTFTTYTPDNVSGSCVPKAGTSRIYQMSLTDATPVNLWADTDPDADKVREFELKTPSIIDEPVIICTGDGCDLFVGPEQPPIDTLEGGNIIRAYWRQDN